MRHIVQIVIGLLLAAGAANAQEAPGAREAEFQEGWSRLLAVHVRGGLVDYGALAEDRAELDRLVAGLATVDPESLSPEKARAAFWINAYNLLVVASIVDRYPVSSPKQIPGFFDRKRHDVGGRRLTLDEIEKRELRETFRDPRVHFALVCAALSCPPLVAEAYTGRALEEQLEARARAVIGDPAFVRLDAERSEVVVSKIFRWYQGEFEGSAGSLARYLQRYGRGVPKGFRLRFSDYDWSLNDEAAFRATGAGDPAESPTEHPGAAVPVLRYTPSALLAPGEVELQIFNNLYTQTAFFDGEGSKQDQDGRSTYYTGTISFKSGWSPRLNPGVDATVKYVKDELFRAEDNPFFRDDSRVALTALTPNLQFVPFAGVPTLSIETGLALPVGSNLDGFDGPRRQWPFLDSGDPAWLNEIFYDWSFAERFLAFFRVGGFLRFNSDDAQLKTPFTTILNHYPAGRWTVYALGEIAPDWVGDGRGNYYSQIGGGAKFRVTPAAELEVLFTTFPAGENNGAGKTFNLGLRLLE